MTACNSAPTPLPENAVSVGGPSTSTTDDSTPPPLDQGKSDKYRQAVGALLYAANATRPDIAFATSMLAQQLKQPTQRDWSHLLRVFRYLKGTIDKGIFFTRSTNNTLTTYTDASYGGNIINARSTSGILIKLNGPIVWRSIRQRLITKSATDAEIVALVQGCEEVIWVQQIITELGIRTNVIVNCDSSSAVKIANDEHAAARAKHINVRYQLLAELVKSGKVTITHLAGSNMIADILTKPLGPILFNKFVPCLRGDANDCA